MSQHFRASSSMGLLTKNTSLMRESQSARRENDFPTEIITFGSENSFLAYIIYTAEGVGDWPADEDHIAAAAAAVVASMHLVLIASSAWGRSRGSADERRVGVEDGEHKQNDRRSTGSMCVRALAYASRVRACVRQCFSRGGRSERAASLNG
ncbi:Uncharacterized protein FWK35_00020886 [Aphis craccivora]|uniref:Uncharacterized protein n=1 Tax=Aphis craccivora TaxID=307492 RepID=A0A6G0ZD05_APHCR|nr:Uncharacterized protein FWK35_00020886 [Aphis craccivora]